MVPIIAPATVPTLSDNIALLISLTLPCLSTLPATLATEVNVPAVSKKSINNKVNITVDIPAVIAADKSNSNRYVIGGGELTIPLKFASPVAQEMILNTKIPIMIFPLTFIFSNTIIAMNVAQPNSTKGLLR